MQAYWGAFEKHVYSTGSGILLRVGIIGNKSKEKSLQFC